jgi:hypothetical protein
VNRSELRERTNAPADPLPASPTSAAIARAASTRPRFVPVSGAADEMMALRMSSSFACGRADQSSAANPATCGVAMLVPSYRSYCPGAVVDRMPTPGAATRAPRFENDARVPSGVIAPTESTSSARFAGKLGRGAPSFPAAATKRTPRLRARAIDFAIAWLCPLPPQLALMTRAPWSTA